jgi:hypothetical protein
METELEHLLVNTYKDEMIAYMATHPEKYDEAIQLAISEKQPYSWRAAWLLWSCMEKNDQRIQKYVKDIISSLPSKNDDHQRELIKILEQMEIAEEYESFLFDFCITNWKTIDKSPSVRFNAFKMMVKIVKRHPDLANEIEFLTENKYMETLSSSAQKSIYKMLEKRIKKGNTGGNNV